MSDSMNDATDALVALADEMMEVVGTCNDIGLLGAFLIDFSNRVRTLAASAPEQGVDESLAVAHLRGKHLGQHMDECLLCWSIANRKELEGKLREAYRLATQRPADAPEQAVEPVAWFAEMMVPVTIGDYDAGIDPEYDWRPRVYLDRPRGGRNIRPLIFGDTRRPSRVAQRPEHP